ncbi:ABC transporter ATP-binding protein/permease [Lachnoclostridium phytofermentans]|uniref:ABC transporter ATP-binding protein/permease n=1 Tax=Lachnoclostridium phytofermentans TaxID=66219 RepID=UPI0004971150|nr:ABC transporter ATP-binding protein/permease [Lachnoclostridium phytofermentans]
MIRIKNLNKKYGGTLIFDNASFSFPNKGLVCVLGPSGCGKSTLLNLIAGFDSDFDGEISVHGTSLSEMNASELYAYRRDNIGFVFQNYHLISGYTAIENILLASDAVGASRADSELKARELLQKLGLFDKAEQKIETLSGGQKQRVAIARALINNPSVILADEPTGALDRKNSSEIMELLKELSKRRLVLVITHDKKCAEYAEQVVTITDGKLMSENENVDSVENTVLSKAKAPKISMLKRAFQNFKVHLTRYVAIALALSIGVLCFTLSLSSGNIINQSITDFEAKNTAYHNGYIKVDGNEKELLDLLSKDERLENVYLQYVLSDVSIKIREQAVNMAEKYPMAKATEQMSYGVMPRRGQNEIALSPSIAAKFDKDIQNLINKTAEVSYNGQTYSVTISGIFNASYDDFFISSDIEQKIYENISAKAYSVSYDVTEFEDIVSVSDSLKEQKIVSQNASAEVGAFQNTFKNLNRLFFTVSVLIFAIGLFISTIMLVKQQNIRYHEIGLLSALGYSKGNIRTMISAENLILSIVSALSTLVLTALTIVVGKVIGFTLMLTVLQVLIAVSLTIVLILTIGFISSFKLINTEPAKALRK